MTSIQRTLFILTLGAFTSLAATAAEVQVTATSGVTVSQLDFPADTSPLIDSSVGLLDVNLLTLRGETSMNTGYVNMVRGGEWVVKNLPVMPEAEYPYSNISIQFDLGVSEGTDVTTIEALMLYSDTLYQTSPMGAMAQFTVGSKSFAQGGITDVAIGATEFASPTEAPNLTGITFGDFTNNRQVFQLDHPNLEAASNQCFPMSVANSLQFLENTTQLKLPHSHVAGLKSDQSLVGQLDSLMQRNVTSRRVGEGINAEQGIQGKLLYLAENNLHERVTTRHWGFFGDTDYALTKGENTARSKGQGAIDFNKVIDALDEGEDCEAAYLFPKRGGGFGGHAVDLVAAGYIAGQPFVIESSDIEQRSDTLGAGESGFLFSFLNDIDNDTHLNMNGTKQELRFMMCQRFVPEKVPSGTNLPGLDTFFYIPGASLKIEKTTDPAGHSCCAEFPPNMLNLEFVNGQLVITAGSSSVPWLPMTLGVNSSGGINGSNTSSVAGFSNISNSIVGSIGPDSITAQISLGNNGGLPQGLPIKFDVTITPSEDWPWLFKDATPVLDPAIRINGFRGTHTVQVGQPISLGISLAPGVQSAESDWWLIVESSGSYYSYDAASANWVLGVAPTLTSQPMQVDSLSVHSFPTGLPAGDYNFYFGLDSIPNAQLDEDGLIFDQVSVSVVEP